jgi:uncharacterized protein
MKFFSAKLNHYWRQVKDFCVFRILHADDPPHRLALGIAIGLFVTFLPLIGIQMVLTLFLSWLLRANKLVGVPLVWISNPLTLPIYYPGYWLGCKLLGVPTLGTNWSELKTAWTDFAPQATWLEKLRFWWDTVMEFIWPLGLGSLIVASLIGVLSYYFSLLLIRHYRIRRWGQLMPPGLTPKDIDSMDQGGEAVSSQ